MIFFFASSAAWIASGESRSLVVLVERVANAVAFEAEHVQARLELLAHDTSLAI